ncbi:MAG: hypothetical protein PHF83_04560, partial [Candidatus Methanomethylophilus sp.]|nr:hypothetical protein [Methanomethylophilus sp.]
MTFGFTPLNDLCTVDNVSADSVSVSTVSSHTFHTAADRPVGVFFALPAKTCLLSDNRFDGHSVRRQKTRRRILTVVYCTELTRNLNL